MNQRIPIPPRSVLRLKKLWPHARSKGHEKGEIRRVGYYSRQDGLDCVWLVDAKGNYDWTTDHEWLYEMFEVIVILRFKVYHQFANQNVPPWDVWIDG